MNGLLENWIIIIIIMFGTWTGFIHELTRLRLDRTWTRAHVYRTVVLELILVNFGAFRRFLKRQRRCLLSILAPKALFIVKGAL